METATGECLHDLKFGHHRPSAIQGIDVRIARMGMAGTLAYEVHGPTEEAVPLYDAILAAGEPFGIVKLGWRAWQMNHTANGFPQSFVHFPLPWGEDKGFHGLHATCRRRWTGSPLPWRAAWGTDIKPALSEPVELGWGKRVKFDHDFIGRAALEQEVAAPAPQDGHPGVEPRGRGRRVRLAIPGGRALRVDGPPYISVSTRPEHPVRRPGAQGRQGWWG